VLRQNTPREYGYAFKAWVLVFSFLLWPAAGMDLIFFLGTALSPVLDHSGVVAGVVTVVLFFFFGPLYILFVPFPIYVFIGAPGLGRLIGAAVLRRREFLADADAVLLTRNPAGLARALAKIAAAATGTFGVNPALYHLCVVSPVKRRISWWQMGLATHPPIEKRIGRLEELDAGVDARPAEKPSVGLAKIALFVLAFVAANVLAALAFYFWLLTRARK
jgi:Peptidase family M48